MEKSELFDEIISDVNAIVEGLRTIINNSETNVEYEDRVLVNGGKAAVCTGICYREDRSQYAVFVLSFAKVKTQKDILLSHHVSLCNFVHMRPSNNGPLERNDIRVEAQVVFGNKVHFVDVNGVKWFLEEDNN